MRIAYIYFNDLKKYCANVNASLNMINAFASYVDTTFISSWISKKSMEHRLSFFSLKNEFNHKRVPIILATNNLLLEKITRFIYCAIALIYLKGKYDVIYTRDFSFLFFLSYLPKWLKPSQKVIFEAHTLYHKFSKKVDLNKERRSLSQTDHIISISEILKKDIVSILNITDKKITTLNNGVNISNFNKIMPETNYLFNKYPNTQNKKIIVYTGSFEEDKGINIILKAIKHIKNRNIIILLLGGISKEIREFSEKTFFNKKKVIFDRYLPQEDIIKILKKSDIAIIPHKEKMAKIKYFSPLKIFEYMACGLPILASDTPILREILKADNALFFKTENSRDLAEKIDMLLRNYSLRKKMRQSNFSFSRQFSWLDRAKKIVALAHCLVRKTSHEMQAKRFSTF
ncbi:MAG: glycosyltransferase family 4 protein [Candidatus Bathyarchaeota archaeon]|nr:glycosyltransferase family 4 protein [Candidatus Bathyarchaeota archaeon]